jgi:hypothetical protein
LQTVRLRPRRSFGRGVMTIEQQNHIVGTRAVISAGRTESAQHRPCPPRSQPISCLGLASAANDKG